MITDAAQLEHNSRDCDSDSPVLKPESHDKVGEVIVRPGTLQMNWAATIAAAVRHRIPITLRGAATGNYMAKAYPCTGLSLYQMAPQKLALTPEIACKPASFCTA